MNEEEHEPPPPLKNPSEVIPDNRDVWTLILKNGVLTKRRYVDDYERMHEKWIGISHLQSIRLACKPMVRALSKIDLSLNDYFKATTLRGVMNFKKCFPNTKSAFRIRRYKYGDFFAEIYLGADLSILSIVADGTEVHPFDTASGNKFTHDISEFRGQPVIKSPFFKETLEMIMKNGGLPEGINGFVYETCILSQASPDGVDSLQIYINKQLEFEIIRGGMWNRDIKFSENAEEVERRQREREREDSESDSDSE